MKRNSRVISDRCRYCGCTWTNPCWPACCWIDRLRTVCSAASCYQRAVKDGLQLIKGAGLMTMEG